MNVRSKHGNRRHAAAKARDIDLALAVACALVQPGQCLSYRAIAEITGMSHGGPYVIGQRALKKMRKRLRYTTHRQLGQETAA
jgi:alkylated DNA nucleotide flippase Atl1